MMFRWLPEHEGENIPPYAHTMIGVGAIVINERDQILAVSEKNALIPNSWKLPGGYAEPSEWARTTIFSTSGSYNTDISDFRRKSSGRSH